MQVYKGDKKYNCSNIKINTTSDITKIEFTLYDKLHPMDIAELFTENRLYFYDDIIKGEILGIQNRKIVGLRITYNADSTCKIIIKTKGANDDEC